MILTLVLRSSDHWNKKPPLTCGMNDTDSLPPGSWLLLDMQGPGRWCAKDLLLPPPSIGAVTSPCEPQRILILGRDPIWKGEFRRVTPYVYAPPDSLQPY